jgi:multisubunit Na+/H+ antiporter MnhF subunit
VNPWTLAAGAFLVGGGLPGLWLVARGSAVERLAGLQLTSTMATLGLVAAVIGSGQSSLLIVPLVGVLMSFAGTLVYTRLLGRPS